MQESVNKLFKDVTYNCLDTKASQVLVIKHVLKFLIVFDTLKQCI